MRTTLCMERIYNTSSIASRLLEDPTVPPSQDPDFPTLVAVGDCERCSVKLSIPCDEKVRRLKRSGFVLVSLCIAGICLGAFALFWYKRQEALVVEADKPGSETQEQEIQIAVEPDVVLTADDEDRAIDEEKDAMHDTVTQIKDEPGICVS